MILRPHTIFSKRVKSRGLCVLFSLFFYPFFAQNILPAPTEMTKTAGIFKLKNAYKIAAPIALKSKVQYLSDAINTATQLNGVSVNTGEKAHIYLKIIVNNDLGQEGYTLKTTAEGVEIAANTEGGILYGITSLIQMVYEYRDYGYVNLPFVSIKDKPKFAWRSFMLDAGRQYNTVKYVKKYLNHMAMLKMNVFHWHLTENAGWRIEIKKYPKLTSIGANVDTLPERQGFYTQAEIKDILAYAASLNITVVPEIDIPGHADAAIHAYPEYTCTNTAPKKDYKGMHSPYIFCGGQEKTYTFLKAVLDEVCALFPSKYIHLGGDEAPKTHWDKCPHCQAKIKKEGLRNSHDLQLYFSKQLALHLKSKGRKAIFWDDVLDDDGVKLPDNAVIHWWQYRTRGDNAYKKALENNLEVICGTNYYTYLYFPVVPWASCKENRTFDMRMAYDKNPSDVKNPPPSVLGISACMWGDDNGQEYMNDRRIFPRIYALAEQMWGTGERLPFDAFYEKVKGKYGYLKEIGVDYGPALKEETPKNYRWD
jgi:N-acetyl-beta-hexosaminidase